VKILSTNCAWSPFRLHNSSTTHGEPGPDNGTVKLVSGGDACPSCGNDMAADQRYCLECGHRRGDPRLPFMDAVVFMDAVRQPQVAATAPLPPPKSEKRPGISANASLIAGVGTLLLALGIGVLIGKTGEGGSTNAAATPSVIRVGGGGGGETASTESAGGGGAGAGKGSGGGAAKGNANAAKSKAELSTDSSGTTKAAAEVLKPAGDVELPPPTVEKGGSCDAGAAGCEGGEFTGDFFGE
jgi:hypothetical protein